MLVDRIQIPASDELPSVRDLVNTAMSKRPDVAIAIRARPTDEPTLPAPPTCWVQASLNVVYQT